MRQAGAGPALPQLAAGLAPAPTGYKATAASVLSCATFVTCAMCCTQGLGRLLLLEHLRGKSHDFKLRQRIRTLVGALHSNLPTCLLAGGMSH